MYQKILVLTLLISSVFVWGSNERGFEDWEEKEKSVSISQNSGGDAKLIIKYSTIESKTFYSKKEDIYTQIEFKEYNKKENYREVVFTTIIGKDGRDGVIESAGYSIIKGSLMLYLNDGSKIKMPLLDSKKDRLVFNELAGSGDNGNKYNRKSTRMIYYKHLPEGYPDLPSCISRSKDMQCHIE